VACVLMASWVHLELPKRTLVCDRPAPHSPIAGRGVMSPSCAGWVCCALAPLETRWAAVRARVELSRKHPSLRNGRRPRPLLHCYCGKAGVPVNWPGQRCPAFVTRQQVASDRHDTSTARRYDQRAPLREDALPNGPLEGSTGCAPVPTPAGAGRAMAARMGERALVGGAEPRPTRSDRQRALERVVHLDQVLRRCRQLPDGGGDQGLRPLTFRKRQSGSALYEQWNEKSR
jgi:hypothetical protein